MSTEALVFQSWDFMPSYETGSHVDYDKAIFYNAVLDKSVLAKRDSSLSPVAFVVKSDMEIDENEDLYRQLLKEDWIEDRGEQNRGNTLSKCLIKAKEDQTKIPAVRAKMYIETNRFLGAIRILFETKRNKCNGNIHIIGLDKSIFIELIKKAKPLVSTVTIFETHAESGTPPQESYASSRLPSYPINDKKVFISEDIIDEVNTLLIGNSEIMGSIRQMVLQVSKNAGPFLITGESGTGKENVARAICISSGLNIEPKEIPYITINCGAIPRELFESELFGHEKGAFTSAHINKDGLWQSANGGFLFLDEIGDLALDHQVKILRALESKQVFKVGATKPDCDLSVRIIAATNRPLYSMVKRGEFREDLYYRLAATQIYIPPLCDHRTDIEVLANYFWKSIIYEAKNPKKPKDEIEGKNMKDEIANLADLPKYILNKLQDESNPWVGNVRVLKHTIRALYATYGEEISDDQFDKYLSYNRWIEDVSGDRSFNRELASCSNKWGKDLLCAQQSIMDFRQIIHSLIRTRFSTLSKPINSNLAVIEDKIEELRSLCSFLDQKNGRV